MEVVATVGHHYVAGRNIFGNPSSGNGVAAFPHDCAWHEGGRDANHHSVFNRDRSGQGLVRGGKWVICQSYKGIDKNKTADLGSNTDMNVPMAGDVVAQGAAPFDVTETADAKTFAGPGILADEHMMTGLNSLGKIAALIDDRMAADHAVVTNADGFEAQIFVHGGTDEAEVFNRDVFSQLDIGTNFGGVCDGCSHGKIQAESKWCPDGGGSKAQIKGGRLFRSGVCVAAGSTGAACVDGKGGAGDRCRFG